MMREKPAHYRGGNGKKRRAPGAHKKRAAQALSAERMTVKRWSDYINYIANGHRNVEAAKKVGISMRSVDAYLISNVAAAQQLRDAKLLWNRREWPLHKIEEILEELALGCTVKQAFDRCGVDRAYLGSLYRVLLKDKAIRKLYDEARELGAEAMADDIIDIADETLLDTKKNKDGSYGFDHEAINRSRLRVDTRKWLMGKHVAKRFGDKKHHVHEGDVNLNHAAILSGGRKRLEALVDKRSTKTGKGNGKDESVTIEGEVTPA